MSIEAEMEWMPVLARLNSLILNDEWSQPLAPEVLSTRWCGHQPAPEREILEVEERLGTTLPPSYRSFLAISNGWQPYNHFVERLLPVQEIDWLRAADPEEAASIQECYTEDVITDEDYLDYGDDRHMEALRHRYYPDCLLISKSWGGGGELILLSPQVTIPDHEWEAIFFANWIPGNVRLRTFRDLVVKNVESLEFIQASRSQ